MTDMHIFIYDQLQFYDFKNALYERLEESIMIILRFIYIDEIQGNVNDKAYQLKLECFCSLKVFLYASIRDLKELSRTTTSKKVSICTSAKISK